VLDEESLDEDGLHRRRVERGRVTSFGPGVVHGVSNSGHRPATSVHVYSPPLTSMTFYAGDAEIDRVERTSWDSRR
jgi:predicted metal-dependent enzyme (double-stranded beta helix superfamily)